MNTFRKTLIISCLLFVVGTFLGFAPVFADQEPPVNPPQVDAFGLEYGEETGLGNQDIRVTIANIIRLALGLLGIIALVLVIYGGVRYMTAGGDDQKVTEARKILVNAAIGLAIIMSAYAIVTFIISQLSTATGTGQPNLRQRCADPIFFNDNPDICEQFFPGGGGDGRDPEDACFDAFVAKSLTPNTNATSINDVRIRAVFSKDLDNEDPAEALNVYRNGQLVTREFAFAFRGGKSIVEAVYNGANDCGGVQCALQGGYRVEVTENVRANGEEIQENVEGCPIDLPTEVEFTVDTEDSLDDADPEIVSLLIDGNQGQDIRLVRGRRYNFTAASTDTAGAGFARLEVIDDETRQRFTHFDGPRVVDTSDATPEAPYNYRYRYAISPDAQPLKRYTVSFTINDIDNKSTSVQSSFVIIGEECDDPDLPEERRRAECGFGPGEACEEDWQCADAPCIEGQCAQGFPKILDVSPWEGAAGNYVTILGKNFGNAVGQVTFYIDDEDAQPVQADLVECVNGHQPWNNDYVIVEVPADADFELGDEASIELQSGDRPEYSDRTTDDFGPIPGDNDGLFTKTDEVLPGICDVVSDSGNRDNGVPLAVPGEGVSIFGTNFGPAQGASTLFFDRTEGVVPGDSWNDTEIDSRLPLSLRGTVPVSLEVDGAKSNALPLRITDPGDTDLPQIAFISPSSTTRGSLVTVVGEGFGSFKNRVYLAPNRDTDCSVAGACVVGDLEISTECSDSSWKSKRIVFQVPEEGVELGTYYIVVEKTGGLFSREFPALDIVDGDPRPGLCDLAPATGPAPLPGENLLTLKGINFDNTAQIFFYKLGAVVSDNRIDLARSWLATTVRALEDDENDDSGRDQQKPTEIIRTHIPFDAVSGLSMQTGPILIATDAGVSNGLEYTVFNCLEAEDFEVPEGFQCCQSGREAGLLKRNDQLCLDEVREAGYVYRFTTGKIPQPPYVEEQCEIPSPSPWDATRDGQNVCLNAQITMRFSTEMDHTSMLAGGGSLQNVSIYTCGKGAFPRCDYELNEVTDDFDGEAIRIVLGETVKSKINIDPLDGVLDPDTWYRVVLDNSIQSDRLEIGLGGEEKRIREPLQQTRRLRDMPGSAYHFDFKTTSVDGDVDGDGIPDDGLCTLTGADVLPPYVTTYVLGLIKHPHEEKPLYYYVQGRANQACRQIGVDGLGWNWSIDRQDLPGNAADYAEVRRDPNPPRYTDSRAVVEAVQHTNGQEIDVLATLPRGEESDLVASSTLVIALGDPEVVAFEPDCVESCINAAIRVQFNINMDPDRYPQGIRLHQCEDVNCVNQLETFDAEDFNFTVSEKTEVVFQLNEHLLPDTYYKVELNGPGTGSPIVSINKENEEGVIEEYGKPLPPFEWVFKTNDNPEPCAISQVRVIPAEYRATAINEKAYYTVAPRSAANKCSSRGQFLNPYDYGWFWESDDTQVATVSDFDTENTRKRYCSDDCLPVGSDIAYEGAGEQRADDLTPAVCGDGIVEENKGEQCDIEAAGEVAGQTCSLRCTRPGISREPIFPGECLVLAQTLNLEFNEGDDCNSVVLAELLRGTNAGLCGDGNVNTNIGEACDPGNFQDAEGNTLIVNNDPFCTSSCTLRGSQRFSDEDQIPVYENYGGEGQNVFASNCGDGEATRGESCDYNDPDQLGGCSQQCLLTGSRVEAAWCEAPENDIYLLSRECLDPISVCGNGQIEFGEECEVGMNGAVFPAEGRSIDDVTCNARCLVQNACGTPLAQCNPNQDTPEAVGCNIDCTFAGASLQYGQPSLCGDGRLGIGEYRREDRDGNIVFQCEPDNVDNEDNLPGSDPAQVVTAIGAGEGEQNTLIRATQIDAQNNLVDRVSDESEFYLQCGYEEFEEKRLIGLDGAFLPIGANNVVPDSSFEDNVEPRAPDSVWQDAPFAGVQVAQKSANTAYSGLRSLYLKSTNDDQRQGGRLILELPLLPPGDYRYTFRHKVLNGVVNSWISARGRVAPLPGDGRVLVNSGVPVNEEPEVLSECEQFGNICGSPDQCGVIWDSSRERDRQWLSQNIGGWNLCRTLNFPGRAGMYYVVKKNLSQYELDGNQVPLVQHYGGSNASAIEDCRNLERYRDADGNLDVGFVKAVGGWDGVQSTNIRTIEDEEQLLEVIANLSSFKGPEPGGNNFYDEGDILNFEGCVELPVEEIPAVDPADFPWGTTNIDFTVAGEQVGAIDLQLGIFGEGYFDDFSIVNVSQEGDFNNCPIKDGNVANSQGVGANSCCYPRASRVASTPQDGQGIFDDNSVCRNPLISVTFDGLIDESTILDAVLVAQGYSQNDPAVQAGEGRIQCPVGQFNVSDLVAKTYEADIENGLILAYEGESDQPGFFRRLWAAIVDFFRKYVWEPVFASEVSNDNIDVAIWCAGSVGVTDVDLTYPPPDVAEGEEPDQAPRTTARFTLDNVLAPESVYAFVMRGGIGGIRDTKGVGIMSPDIVDDEHFIYDSIIFQSDEEICKISKVTVDPTEYLFSRPNTSTLFTAKAIHINDNNFEQEIASTPSYMFRWTWEPKDQPLFNIPVGGVPEGFDPEVTDEGSIIEIGSTQLEGKLSVNAGAEITEDVDFANNHTGKIFSGFTKLTADFCENPWPARAFSPYEDGVSFERLIAGEPNNDGFNNAENAFDGSAIPGVTINGREEFFNFSMSYCADAGLSGNTNDDLPFFRPKIVEVVGQCEVSGNACSTADDCGYLKEFTPNNADPYLGYAQTNQVCIDNGFLSLFYDQVFADYVDAQGRNIALRTYATCQEAEDCRNPNAYGDTIFLQRDGIYEEVPTNNPEVLDVIDNARCQEGWFRNNQRENCVFNAEDSADPLKQYIMFSDINDDAIAVQIYANPRRETANDWYTSIYNNLNDFAPVTLANYDAITNGNQYYINALNRDSQGEIKNYIYHFTLNENAQPDSREVFEELIQSLEFNINMSDFGYCSIPEVDLEDGRTLLNSPKMVNGVQCATDFDCRDQNGQPLTGTSGVCANEKTKFFRDWDRLANLETVQTAIANGLGQTGQYPQLSGGTFIPGYTNSRLGSWNNRLSEELGGEILTSDPINEWTLCGHCNEDSSRFCTSDEMCGEGDSCKLLDSQTCWDEEERVLVCPAYSQVFEYSRLFTDEGGEIYRLHGKLEYFDTDDSIFNEFVPNPQFFTQEPWCQPNAIHSPFGETCGDGVVNVNNGEQCDPPGTFESVNSTPDGQCEPGNRATRTCNELCQYEYSACEPTGECGNGIVEGGESCDDGALNGQYGQCNDNCSGAHEAFCGNGAIDTDLNGNPLEFCENIDALEYVLTATILEFRNKIRISLNKGQINSAQLLAGDEAVFQEIATLLETNYDGDDRGAAMFIGQAFLALQEQLPSMIRHSCSNNPKLTCNPERGNDDCLAPSNQSTLDITKPFNDVIIDESWVEIDGGELVNFGECIPREGKFGADYYLDQEFSCSDNCRTIGGYCGDGIHQRGFEQCDDGNLVDNDGCSSICETEDLACIESTPRREIEVDNGKTTITKRYHVRTPEACLDTTGQNICNGFGLECSEVTTLQEQPSRQPHICAIETKQVFENILNELGPIVNAIDVPVELNALEGDDLRTSIKSFQRAISAVNQNGFNLSLFAQFMKQQSVIKLFNTVGSAQVKNDLASLYNPSGAFLPPVFPEERFEELMIMLKRNFDSAYDENCVYRPTVLVNTPVAEDQCNEILTSDLDTEVSIVCDGEINIGAQNIGRAVAGSCGDGVKQDGEACDLGGKNGIPCDPKYGSSCNYCNADCSRVLTVDANRYCGNGKIDWLLNLDEERNLDGFVVNAEGSRLFAEECDFNADGSIVRRLPGLRDQGRYHNQELVMCIDKGSYECLNDCTYLVEDCIDCRDYNHNYINPDAEGSEDIKPVPKLAIFNPLTPDRYSNEWRAMNAPNDNERHVQVHMYRTRLPEKMMQGPMRLNENQLGGWRRFGNSKYLSQSNPYATGRWYVSYPDRGDTSVDMRNYMEQQWVFTYGSHYPLDRGYGHYYGDGNNANNFVVDEDRPYRALLRGIETDLQCADEYSIYFNSTGIGNYLDEHGIAKPNITTSISKAMEDERIAFYEQYGSFFPYPVNGERRYVQNELLVVPAVPRNTYTVVIRWENDDAAIANGVQFHGNVALVRSMNGQDVINRYTYMDLAADADLCRAENLRTISQDNNDYFIPDCSHTPEGGVSHSRNQRGVVQILEVGGLENIQAQATTFNINTSDYSGKRHPFYVTAFSDDIEPMARFTNSSLRVEVYDYRENQVSLHSLYLPKDENIFRARQVAGSQNQLAKYWHVFDVEVYNEGNQRMTRIVPLAGKRNGSLESCFVNIQCNINPRDPQCLEQLPENCQ